MQKLIDFNVSEDEIITSDKINNFCCMMNRKHKVYTLQYIKTDFIRNKKTNETLIYQHGWRGYNNLIDLNKVNVIVTGHSDYDINENYVLINKQNIFAKI